MIDRTVAENASLNSKKSMSLIVKLALFSAFFEANSGAMQKSIGSS